MTEDARESFLADVRRLWDVAASTGRDPRAAFDSIGLLLEPPDRLEAFPYDATPSGALTFASTGGDGVHFSGIPSGDEMVIIMTVPMMWDRPNLVVGRDVHDFLSLGCRYGYFSLEQLVYDVDTTARKIEACIDEEPVGDLALVSRELHLRPVTDVVRHLAALARHLPAQ